MADPPQIRTRFRSSHNDHLPGAFKFSQRVEASSQFSPAEIETGDGQKILIRYDSYDVILFGYRKWLRNTSNNLSLNTFVDHSSWKTRVAITFDGRFDTGAVNSALACVRTGIVSRPEIAGNSISVVPPRIGDAVEFKRRPDAIVLFEK